MDDVNEYFCANITCNNSWYSGATPPVGRLCDPCSSSSSVSDTCMLCRIVLVPFYSNYYDENGNPQHIEIERTCECVGMNHYACRHRQEII